MAYMAGFNNYTTHAEAKRNFYRSRCHTALTLMDDGSATITYLQAEPVYPGQAEYVGSKNTQFSVDA